jgi:hypothetical protein
MRLTPTAELIIGLALPFVALVPVDLALVPLGDQGFGAGAIFLAAVVSAPVLFFRFFRRVLPQGRPHLGPGRAVVCTIISFPPWLYAAVTVFANIHLALGGAL